jgi:hypothetical protein
MHFGDGHIFQHALSPYITVYFASIAHRTTVSIAFYLLTPLKSGLGGVGSAHTQAHT